MYKKILFFSALVVLLIGIFAVSAWQRSKVHIESADTPSTVEDPTPVPQNTYTPPAPTSADPSDAFRYTNEQFKFSLLYPSELSVTEYKEAGGALSVSLEEQTGEKGFQIYVTPYADAQITDQRFKLDEPSGVRENPTDVLIDGARATMFFGKNSAMGDTREVWFIYPEPSRGVQSYLYEVTTYKDLDTWLGSIMQTWKFL